MIARGSGRTLLAGVLLIVMANAAVLAAVAWNRSGAPEAVLRMSGRELRPPFAGVASAENSGLSLAISWQVLTAPVGAVGAVGASGVGASPAWLDEARIAALGFEIPADGPVESRRLALARQLSREVLVVLELDGPAYRQAVERARQWAEQAQARSSAEPGAADLKRRAERAAEGLHRARTTDSRLFVVDAGLDAAALRAAWPDVSRHAIVEGRIRAALVGPDDAPRVSGYLIGLNVPRINVPSRHRPELERALATIVPDRRQWRPPVVPGLEVEAAFGRRLEPWIRSIAWQDNEGAGEPAGREEAPAR